MDKVFVVLSILAAMAACDKGANAVVVDTHFDMLMRNAAGQDLFDPATFGAFSEDNIKLYHRIDNEKVYYYQNKLDIPKGFKLLKGEDLQRYYLRIFPDGEVKDDESMLYLGFKGEALDSIRIHYNASGPNVVCTKIWYNNKQVWDVARAQDGRYFEIVK